MAEEKRLDVEALKMILVVSLFVLGVLCGTTLFGLRIGEESSLKRQILHLTEQASTHAEWDRAQSLRIIERTNQAYDEFEGRTNPEAAVDWYLGVLWLMDEFAAGGLNRPEFQQGITDLQEEIRRNTDWYTEHSDTGESK